MGYNLEFFGLFRGADFFGKFLDPGLIVQMWIRGMGADAPYPHKRGVPPPQAGRPRGGPECKHPDTPLPRYALEGP
jgi:hypothetical protein